MRGSPSVRQYVASAPISSVSSVHRSVSSSATPERSRYACSCRAGCTGQCTKRSVPPAMGTSSGRPALNASASSRPSGMSTVTGRRPCRRAAVDDAVVAGAPAEVAGHELAHRESLEQLGVLAHPAGRHHDARRARAALRRAAVQHALHRRVVRRLDRLDDATPAPGTRARGTRSRARRRAARCTRRTRPRRSPPSSRSGRAGIAGCRATAPRDRR